MKLFLFVCAALPAVATDLTIYNEDFAVVREIVPLDLKAGINEARFASATAQVEADSVILRDPAGKAAWQILEQGYRNDPVSERLLLSLFEGQAIDFLRQEAQKPDRIIRGKVIRSGYVPGEDDGEEGEKLEPIIEVDGKLVFELPGRPQFPALDADTILKPTLTWKVNAPAPVKTDAELAYVTGGLNWKASYNVVQAEKGETMDLAGWVTMENHSGTTFSNARIKLMAGDVHKVRPPAQPGLAPGVFALTGLTDPSFQVTVRQKPFEELQLYTLAHPTTLRHEETKQVEFARAAGVKGERIYVYDGAIVPDWTRGTSMGGDPGYGITSNKKVAVYREIKNSEGNKLGMPLPKGRLRFYTQDAEDGSMQFVGENDLDHTPKDELIRVYVGSSFDLAGERKQMEFTHDEANHRAEEAFEIKVRNHKSEPAEIRIVEHLNRWAQWEVIKKSQEFTKKDAQTIEFRVALKPGEEKVVTYRARYMW